MRELLGMFYIIRFVLCGAALGVFFVKINIFTKFTSKCVFGVGFCTTPLFVSFFDYVCGLLLPGIPEVVLVCGLPLAAIVYLTIHENWKVFYKVFADYKKCIVNCFFYGRNKYLTIICCVGIVVFFVLLLLKNHDSSVLEIYALQVIRQRIRWLLGVIIQKKIFVVLFLACVYVFVRKKERAYKVFEDSYKFLLLLGVGFLGCIIIAYSILTCSRDLYEHDRSHYELQARYFAETRESLSIDNYKDEKYGTVFRDDHGPLWPVYISDARMVSMGKDDYFNPLTIDIAYLMATLCYLGMTALAAIMITGRKISGALSIFMLCIYKEAWTLYLLGSRDSFRMLGILLLALYILDISMRLFEREDLRERCLRKRDYIVIILFCHFCMQGHGGSVYIMLGLFAVFGCVALSQKMRLQELAGMAACVLIGTVLGMLKTIFIFCETGRLNSSSVLVFEGTKAAERYQQSQAVFWTWGSIVDTYSFSDVVLIMMGIAGILYVLICMYKKWKNREHKIEMTEVFALLVVGMLLPLTGIMDIFGYRVSVSFLLQIRYRLYFLVLLSIMGAVLFENLKRERKRRAEVFCGIVFTMAVSLFISLAQYKNASVGWVNSITASYKEFASQMEMYAKDGEIYVVEEEFAYYFHKNPKLLYAPVSRELIIAKTDDEIKAALENLNIRVIALNPPMEWRYDYDLLPFYHYMQNDKNAEQVILHAENGNELPIYVIK